MTRHDPPSSGPSRLEGVLVRAVLGVVEQDVDVGRERRGPRATPAASRRDRRVRAPARGRGCRRASDRPRQPVSDGRPWMRDGVPQGSGAADCPLLLGTSWKLSWAGTSARRTGKERRRNVAGDAVLEAPDRRGRTPDVELGVLAPEGREEAQALEVVEVEVRQEEVDRAGGSASSVAPSRRMPVPASRTMSVAFTRPKLDARGVAPVAERPGPGVAIDPRQPQIRARMRALRCLAARRLPEDGHRADRTRPRARRAGRP